MKAYTRMKGYIPILFGAIVILVLILLYKNTEGFATPNTVRIIGTVDSNTENPFTFNIKKSDNPNLAPIFSSDKWILNFTDPRFFNGVFSSQQNNVVRQSSDGFLPVELIKTDNTHYYFKSWFGANGAKLPKGTQFTVSYTPIKIVGIIDSNTSDPFTFKVKISDNPKLAGIFDTTNWVLNFTDPRFFNGVFNDDQKNVIRQENTKLGFARSQLIKTDNTYYYFNSWFGAPRAVLPKGTQFTVSNYTAPIAAPAGSAAPKVATAAATAAVAVKPTFFSMLSKSQFDKVYDQINVNCQNSGVCDECDGMFKDPNNVNLSKALNTNDITVYYNNILNITNKTCPRLGATTASSSAMFLKSVLGLS